MITTYLFACKDLHKGNDYLYDLSTAKDAFDYPNLSNKTDTDIYVYQLKDTLNRRDSFLYVYYGSNYLKQFNEENLSLRPSALETFRFSYTPFGRKPINITFDKDKITVKLWKSGSLDRIYNYSKLDSLEFIKFRFLERYFFRSRESLSDRSAKYCDSMFQKYPELRSIKYYKQLMDKFTDSDSLKFIYTTLTIPLSKNQYSSIIDSLKNSNFNNLPWSLSSVDMVPDGGGYTFEANTKTKFKFFVCYYLPIDSLPMTKFCRYLLKLSRVDKETKL